MKLIRISIILYLLTSSILAKSQDNFAIDSLSKIITTTNNNLVKIDCYFKIAEQFKLTDYEKATENYKKALDIANQINDKKHQAELHNNLGLMYYYIGDIDKSLIEYSKSLQKYDELNDNINFANCMNCIGVLYNEQGNYEHALKWFLRALNVFEKINQKKGISKCYNNIGILSKNQGNYDKALIYFQKSLKIDEAIGDKEDISYCYNNIGVIYRNKKMYLQALYYFEKSLEIEKELENKQSMSSCYNNIGNVYLFRNDCENALNNYLKSLELKREIGSKLGTANVLGNIASLYNENKCFDKTNRVKYSLEAIKFANEGLGIAKEINSIPEQNHLLFQLQVAFKNLRQFEKALEYAELYISTKELLFDEDKTNALTEMEVKYESNQKDQKIQQQIKDKQIQDREISRQRTLIIAFIVVCVITLVILFLLRD